MDQPTLYYPPRPDADAILEWAASFNPGLWVHHSRMVALACKLIAEKIPLLDPLAAESAGLLHDIGRRFPGTNIRHCTDGYRIMRDRGFPFNADICISHCFLHRSLSSYTGKYDIDAKDEELISTFLADHRFDEYDSLVQLCDAFTDGRGFCLIEKRLVDVALRYGLTDAVIEKWKLILDLKQHFDDLLGHSVYKLLPGIADNTFEWERNPSTETLPIKPKK
jgi:putative nucleotidyltransferase with HDIG domain